MTAMKQFSFWNRTYAFDGSPMPSSMKVGDKDLLTAPMQLRMVKDGNDIPWVPCEPIWQCRTENGENYIFATENDGANIVCDTQMRVEDDGFVWFDVTFIPCTGRFPEFDQIFLDIPLKAEYCQLLYHYSMEAEVPVPLPMSGSFPKDGAKLPFVGSLWIGEEDRGFTFLMEGAKGCIINDKNCMIELIPNGDTALMRLHMLDQKPTFWYQSNDHVGCDCQPVTISFGFMATPVREFKKVPGFERTYHLPYFAADMDTVKEAVELGVKYIILHEDWTLIQNYNYADDKAKLCSIIDYCHSNDVKVLLYFGYEFSSLMPDFHKVFLDYACEYKPDHYVAFWLRKPPQRDFVACYAGGYSDVQIEQVAAAMDQYHVDGIYTDGTFMPRGCCNEHHGCGWRDYEGNRHISYPILALREHLRRLTETVHARGGIVDAHTGAANIPALLSFADSYWDGEYQGTMLGQNYANIDFSILRAQYSGRNFGVPAQLIMPVGPNTTYDNVNSMILVCGMAGRPFWNINDLRQAASVWKILDEFGTDDAEFYPPWNHRGMICTDNENVAASCWVKDGKALAVFFNRTTEPITTNVTCNGTTREIEVQPRKTTFINF